MIIVHNLFTPISTRAHANITCFQSEILTLKRNVVFLVYTVKKCQFCGVRALIFQNYHQNINPIREHCVRQSFSLENIFKLIKFNNQTYGI